MKSITQYNFSQSPPPKIERSLMRRDCGYKTTFNAGYLIPIFSDDILPGDTVSLQGHYFARLATPLKPIMDNMFFDVHWFFVPLRLLWANFKMFMGEQVDPMAPTPLMPPVFYSPSHPVFDVMGVGDYLGIPPNIPVPGITTAGERPPTSLYHRAYSLIFNEWYRSEDLIPKRTFSTGDGPDSITDYDSLSKRCKRHDYFTSCLLWPQKGQSIDVPIVGQFPVVGNGMALGLSSFSGTYEEVAPYVYNANAIAVSTDGFGESLPHGNGGTNIPGNSYILGVTTDPDNSGLIGDMSAGTSATTVNTLRQCFQLQIMLEKDARGGTRYVEIIRSHFGVISPDARQQRPELIGLSSQRVSVNPVQQTQGTGASGTSTPQGNLAAFGIVAHSDNRITYSSTEHGILMAIASVRSDLTYQQGLERRFTRQTREEFYWPSLAHLGEQAVLNQEIYWQGSDDVEADLEAFGYQERWAEYRYKPSLITGQFRSTHSTPLDMWHLSQEFTDVPELGQAFIEEAVNDTLNRCIAVSERTAPQFLLDAYFDYKHARPMPVRSIPGLIDHF